VEVLLSARVSGEVARRRCYANVVSRVDGRYESIRGLLRCTNEAQRLDQLWHYVKVSPLSLTITFLFKSLSTQHVARPSVIDKREDELSK